MAEESKFQKSRTSDPYSAYHFLVEIDGDGVIAGGFTEVSGLSIETEVETIREGGANDIEYKLPKGTKYSNITLKHGITDSDILWKWYKNVIDGKINRKNCIIFLLDQSGKKSLQWGFVEAYPIKWEGPAFNATTNTVAIETLVLAHHGLKKN